MENISPERRPLPPKVTDRNIPFFNLLKEENNFLEGLTSSGKSFNTVKNYRTDLKCFNEYWKMLKQDLNLSGFGIEQILDYGAFLDNKYSSDNSKRRRVQALRIFFDYLVKKGFLKSNPVRKLPTSPKFLDIPHPTPFLEVKKLWIHLIEETKSENLMTELLARRNQIIVLLIFGSGLKVSDLANLKQTNVFFSDPSRVMLTPPKRDPYSIPLPEAFPLVFKDYQKLLDKQKDTSNISFEEILFNANPFRILSGSLSPRGLEVVFKELSKKTSLSITPKSLRQACIFRWLQKGDPENLIKEWMGVAPSYQLKLYKEHLNNFLYNEDFLQELYLNKDN